MLTVVKFLGWILLGVAVLGTVCVYLEIKAKRDLYRILEKVCFFTLAALGVVVGIIGLLAK